MNTRYYLPTALIIILSIVLSFTGQSVAQTDQPPASALPAAIIQTDTTLDVCMHGEPNSLYYYEDQLVTQRQILSAIYDGPMDQLNYSYQPVIFESVPTLDNGGAITQMITVSQGYIIVDSSGNVVPLQDGISYLPAGCYEESCAISYSGGSVDMEQMVVTQTLKTGLLWSDGQPLTSADMVYSFDLNADPETPAEKSRIEQTESYLAPSLTESVWTGRPGYFPYDYSGIYWIPMPEHIWGNLSAADLLEDPLSNETPLGWGAYVIDEWVRGSHISMHKNPNYFRAAEGLPKFDTLVVHFGTELFGMLDGTCDYVGNSSEDLATLLNYDDAGLFEVDFTASATWEHLDFGILPVDTYTGFAGVSDAFQDLRVRQAFAYCIDRQEMADSVFAGLGVVANAFIPDLHPDYPADATTYPYDPAQGRVLLAAAGWVDTNADGIRDQDGVEFSVTLKTTTAALRVTTASLIAAQMAECGIQVIPEHLTNLFQDWPDGPIFGRQFDLGMFAWVASWAPSCDLYASWNIPSDANPSGQNDPGYSYEIYDTACRAALGSLSEADREANIGDAIRIFTQELPVLPLFQRLTIGIAAPHITGFTLDPTDYTFWYIEELSVGVESEIPTEGGTLESPEDTTEYVFAADTFTETVVITHTPLSPVVLPPLDVELEGAGHFYSLEATLEGDPVQPSQPYTVTIEYTDGELGNIMEDTLGLYYWDGDSWELEPSAVVDPLTNTLVATPDHFSYWALLGEPYQIRFLPFVYK
jgi:peptide/nickel transport system substrate-binding protein